MPGTKRVTLGGYAYHVLNRANGRLSKEYQTWRSVLLYELAVIYGLKNVPHTFNSPESRRRRGNMVSTLIMKPVKLENSAIGVKRRLRAIGISHTHREKKPIYAKKS